MSYGFIMIILELWIFRRKSTELKCHSGIVDFLRGRPQKKSVILIWSACCGHDISLMMLALIIWPSQYFLGFCTVKLLFFHFNIMHFWREVTTHSPLKGKSCSTFLRLKYILKLFGIPLYRRWKICLFLQLMNY